METEGFEQLDPWVELKPDLVDALFRSWMCGYDYWYIVIIRYGIQNTDKLLEVFFAINVFFTVGTDNKIVLPFEL